MGKPTGFKEIPRETPPRRPVELRILDWNEIYLDFPEDKLRKQGARCMDCGIPFCHNGCPLGNIIPEWNDLIYKQPLARCLGHALQDQQLPGIHRPGLPGALRGSLRPGHQRQARHHQAHRTEHHRSRLQPRAGSSRSRRRRTGKKVAVVGSGPGRLAAAAQLNQGRASGHRLRARRPHRRTAHVRHPQLQTRKNVVDRRIKLMEDEGITFVTNANVGFNVKVDDLRRDFDAIVLCGGATKARDLPVPGRELAGIHSAMDYLPQQNSLNLGDTSPTSSSSTPRQARHHPRRRRHRRRLPRHRPAPRLRNRQAVRAAPRAAGIAAPPTVHPGPIGR